VAQWCAECHACDPAPPRDERGTLVLIEVPGWLWRLWSELGAMVEVLKACTQNHAPLSQAQTVKVFQYLEDMNKDTRREIQDMKRTYESQTSGIGDSKGDMKTLHARVSTAQEELVKANTRMSALRVDVLGNAANVVVLQEQAGKSSQGLGQLLEGQKVTNTNVHNLREEHLIAKEEIRKLQKEVASLKEAKENVVQAKLDRVMLALQHCKEDLEVSKKRSFDNEDGVRDLRQILSEAKVDVGKLGSVSADHDKRMTELSIKGEKVKENLEMTNGVVMRLHTEHEETRMKAVQNLDRNHEIDVALRRIQEDSSHFGNSVHSLHDDFSKMAAAQDTTRDRLTETVDKVNQLNGGTVNLQNTMHEMGKNLEWVHNLASSTEDHLKMTNAMVLPNLGADNAFNPSSTSCSSSGFANAKAMNSTRGTDMGSSRGSTRTSPRKSPRKQKDAAWYARNIGSVPDRMSWI